MSHNLPRFGIDGGNRVVVPSGKQTNGWDGDEEPFAEYENQLRYETFDSLRRTFRADIIIGSSSEKTDGGGNLATHTIDELEAALGGNPNQVVLVLSGTHTLSGDLTIDESNTLIQMFPGAVIDFDSNDFTNNARILGGDIINIGTFTPQSQNNIFTKSIKMVSGDSDHLLLTETYQASLGEESGHEFLSGMFNFNTTPQDITYQSYASGVSWIIRFTGVWANGLEGGGLTQPAFEIIISDTSNTITVGSNNITVSRNGTTGRLEVVGGGSNGIVGFFGRIDIFTSVLNTGISKNRIFNTGGKIGINKENPTEDVDINGTLGATEISTAYATGQRYDKNVMAKYVSATTVDIDCEFLTLYNGTKATILSAVDLTVDITTSGANGLDTGSEGSDRWYYLYVIYNGTTVAGLLSESSTSPTLPSGYTYFRLVSTVYNDASSNFLLFNQTDDLVQVDWSGFGAILTSATSTATAPQASIDLSAHVPANTKAVRLYALAASDGSSVEQVNASFSAYPSGPNMGIANLWTRSGSASANVRISGQVTVHLDKTNGSYPIIYWNCSSTGTSTDVTAYVSHFILNI